MATATAPATFPERTRYLSTRSQLSPARNARNVINANQTAEALATESITLKAGSRIAPAKGGTIARTPGRKRLTNRPANPYFFDTAFKPDPTLNVFKMDIRPIVENWVSWNKRYNAKSDGRRFSETTHAAVLRDRVERWEWRLNQVPAHAA